ncbi:hypothetical protein ACQEVZ_20345 [Dactylosporangium sp. CA-152071]|uniref:hypothetical protein n=1 Tax=Dactylosporangium sp. CA-152071 TaxID=3239933 RepID=UPI003D8FD4EF
MPALADQLMTRPEIETIVAPEIDAITTLTARHVVGKTVEDDGELLFWIEDGGGTAVQIDQGIGDPEASAAALDRLADDLRKHAERVRYQSRMHTAGWT